jgi:hypothetical protein
MKKYLFLLFFLSAFIFSCDHIETTGYVWGTVMNEAGDVVLSGVVVECGGKTYTTASNGNYTIKDIPVGNQQLTASKADFMSYTGMVNIESGGTRQDINMKASVPVR